MATSFSASKRGKIVFSVFLPFHRVKTLHLSMLKTLISDTYDFVLKVLIAPSGSSGSKVEVSAGAKASVRAAMEYAIVLKISFTKFLTTFNLRPTLVARPPSLRLNLAAMYFLLIRL
jgi:hypothetical protein